MGNLDLYVVIAYMAGILAAGFWARRKATNQEQFLVAGRSVGPTLYAGTLAAIVLGGASTVGGSSSAMNSMLALRGLNSGLPIYAGLAGSLVAYVLVSLGFSRREIEPITG